MSNPDPDCWKCRGEELPPPSAGVERLALCHEHLVERVRDVMTASEEV